MRADRFDSRRTRSRLLEGIKDPDNQQAWGEFYDRYSGVIRDGARRTGLRPDEVEEVVQTVLIEVSKKIGEFAYDRSKGKFGGWLSRLTARRAIDQFRKRKAYEEHKIHRPPDSTGDTRTIDRQKDMDLDGAERVMHEEWVRALHDETLKAVRTLVSPEQFQLYDAYVLKDWAASKVAKTFGVTTNQVYIAKNRVGEVVREEGQRVAKEMECPTLPPPHSETAEQNQV